MPKAVLFDRDGTLLDSENLSENVVSEYLAIKSIEMTVDDLEIIVGKNENDYVGDLVKKYGIKKDDFLEYFTVEYEIAFRKVRTFPDVVSLLHEVHADKNIVTGLVTSAQQPTTDIMLEWPDFRGMFDTVVTYDDTQKHKPYSDPYLLAARNLGVEPRGCTVVEDSPTGLRSGKSAEMQGIIVNAKPGSSDLYPGADRIIVAGAHFTKQILAF